MAKNIWTMICSRVIIDERTNNASIIDVLDEIEFERNDRLKEDGTVHSLPYECTLIALFARSDAENPETLNARLNLATPDDQLIPLSTFEIDLSKTTKTRNIGLLKSLPFTSSGEYSFRIEIDEDAEKDQWHLIGAAPLHINQKIKELDAI